MNSPSVFAIFQATTLVLKYTAHEANKWTE